MLHGTKKVKEVTLGLKPSENVDLVRMRTCSRQVASSCKRRICTGRNLPSPPSQLQIAIGLFSDSN